MFISAGHRHTERRRTGVHQPEQGAMVVTMVVRKGGSGLRPSSSLMTDSPLPNVTTSSRSCRRSRAPDVQALRSTEVGCRRDADCHRRAHEPTVHDQIATSASWGVCRRVQAATPGAFNMNRGFKNAPATSHPLFLGCGRCAVSHWIRSAVLLVWSHTRPGPVKSVTSPSPPRIVDFQLPALRTAYCTVASKATT